MTVDCLLVAFEIDIDTQRTDFLDQHVERLRHAGVDHVVAFDQVLVHFGTAIHVIGLDGQHLLQDIRCAVRFQCPHFHLTEALTTELGFTTQRLLRYQRVRTGRTCMHLVINQVMQFQHVHHADSDLALERFTGAAVIHGHLVFRSGHAQVLGNVVRIRQVQHAADLGFIRTVKHWGSEWNTFFQVFRQLHDLFVVELIQLFGAAIVVVDRGQVLAHLLDLGLRLQHFADADTQTLGSPAQVRLENLTNVHPRRNAQGVQHHVSWRAVGHVWHIFHRNNTGNHTLVTVAARHLVARLQATFHGQVHLDHFLHAWLQLVALRQLLALLFEGQIKLVTLLVDRFLDRFQRYCCIVVRRADVEPVVFVQIGQIFLGDLGAFGQLFRAAVDNFADQHFFQTLEGIVFNDTHLVIQIQTETFQFVIDNLLGAFVAHDAFTGEDLYVDHGTDHARRHAQRGVFHVRSFFAENRAQQLLFRGQLGFAFRRYFTNQGVAGLYFRADVDDTGLIQTCQLIFSQVRDVARDFFRAQFGIACNNRQLFDVNRGVAVVFHDVFRDQDRILEVQTIPWHKRHGHVLAQSQFTQVGRCAVGDHVALGNTVAHLHDRTLVDVGVLVRTGVLDQVVDVDAHFASGCFVIVHANHHTACIDVINDTATQCLYGGARVDRHSAFDTGTDQRFFRTQARHSLALHVGAHQCTVRIIVFEEWNQRGSDGNDLARRNVHVLDALWGYQDGFAGFTGRYQFIGQHACVVDGRIRLSDDVAAFFDGGQVVDLIGDLGAFYLAVWGFQEAVFIQAGVQSQRVDQTNVRTFRCLDRADAAVVGRMHVAHFKAGALTCQTAGSQSRYAALVGNFRQRVGLVHKLRQLGRTEELADGSRNRLRVDQVMRHQVVGFGLAQTFLDCALNTYQTGTELVLSQFAHATYATVTQVIDIVDFAAAIAQFHQDLDHGQHVFVRQRHGASQFITADTAVELHAAHGRQVVAVRVVEQAIEQRFNGVFRWRFAWTHHAVDRHFRCHLVSGVVDTQGLRDVRTLIQVVGVQGLDFGHFGVAQTAQQVFGQLIVGGSNNFTGVAIDDVLRQYAAQQVVFRYGNVFDASRFDITHVFGVDTLVFQHQGLARLVDDVETRNFTAQTLGNEFHLRAFGAQVEIVEDKEISQDLLVRHADCFEQNRHWHLAAAVDAEEQDVFRVELEVQPRTAVRNDTCREQQFTGRVSLAAVVLEEHARRTVQLGNDNTLSAVDHEGTGSRHERQFAHVDFLLFHFFDDWLGWRFLVQDHQTHFRAQRRRERQATLLAFFDVKGRIAQNVRQEFETRKTIVRNDRENRSEGRLQAIVLAAGRCYVLLQEAMIRLELGRQQERNVVNVGALRE